MLGLDKRTTFKILGLISVVRGYNILIIAIAQYLTSIFILAPDRPLRKVLFDPNLFILVVSSALAIAGGYIINSFYDSEKDLINRPRKAMLDRLVSQQTRLVTYFVLNFLSVIVASAISFRAVLFFSAYIFAIWLYSHKLKKIVFAGNIVAAVLSITPFFIVFIYYKNFATIIFVHATFLFLIIAIRELVKDLENLKGDFTQNYRTIPVVLHPNISKVFITFLVILSLLPVYLLVTYFEIGYMYVYFICSTILLLIFGIVIWKASVRRHYVWLHNILKLIIVAGVFSILLIDISVVISRLV